MTTGARPSPQFERIGSGATIADRPAPTTPSLQLGDRWITRGPVGAARISVLTDIGGVRTWVDQGTNGANVQGAYQIDPDMEHPDAFPDWASFWAAYSAGSGPASVYVHDSIDVPAGTYALRQFTSFIGPVNDGAGTIRLRLLDGAHIVDLSEVDGLVIESVSTTPALSWSADNETSALLLHDGSQLKSSGTSPMILWTDPGATRSLIIAGLFGALLVNNGSPVIRVEGTIAPPSNPGVVFFLDGGTTLGPNAATSNADASALVLAVSLSAQVFAQPGWLGPGTPFADVKTVAGVGLDMNFLPIVNVYIPPNPHLYVASTGNDGPTHTGAIGDPLATVGEALRRLKVSSWTGQPIVTVVDAVNEGATPSWNIPEPPAGQGVVLIQGTWATALAATVPTGGTALSFGPVTWGTITTGLVMVADQYKGMFARFTGGALSGQRFAIDGNTVGGVVTLVGRVASAPSNTTPFVIESLVGKVAFATSLAINAPGGAWIDGIEVDLDAGSFRRPDNRTCNPS